VDADTRRAGSLGQLTGNEKAHIVLGLIGPGNSDYLHPDMAATSWNQTGELNGITGVG